MQTLRQREPGRRALLYRLRRGAGERGDRADDAAGGRSLPVLWREQPRARALLRGVRADDGRRPGANAGTPPSSAATVDTACSTPELPARRDAAAAGAAPADAASAPGAAPAAQRRRAGFCDRAGAA